ncbi:MAG: MotA/TolQ/ExbB proton channel family protein [Bilophila sp.]
MLLSTLLWARRAWSSSPWAARAFTLRCATCSTCISSGATSSGTSSTSNIRRAAACATSARSDNPLIAIVRDVVKTHGGHSKDIRAEVAYLFHRNFEGVTKGLCWLRLIAVVSPLLGLLGTILGMVTVFRTIAEHSAPDAAQLAAGIWEALITTIMGLCVAIPMLMFYYYLMLKFKGFHIEAVEHSYRALELCGGARARTEAGRARHA